MISEEGEHELRNEVQRRLSADEISEPLPVKVTKEFKVTKIPFNRTMLICGDVKVRVRDNSKFIPGMVVKARPPAEGYSVWVIEGRGPRWRGRW